MNNFPNLYSEEVILIHSPSPPPALDNNLDRNVFLNEASSYASF